MAFFLIEESEGDRSTPFNLMPVQWRDFHLYFELLSFLPFHSQSISSGWTTDHHLFGQKSRIIPFDQDILSNINDISLDENDIYIIYGNSILSLELIKRLKKRVRYIICITIDKDLYNAIIKINKCYLWKEKPFEEFIHDIYNMMAEIYAENKMLDFHDNIVTSNIYGYSSLKKFIPSGEVSKNILINGNQIILSFLRGHIPTFVSDDYNSHSTDELYALNKEMTLQILSEKNLDYLLSIIHNGMEIPFTLSKQYIDSLKYFLENFTYMNNEQQNDSYFELSKESSLLTDTSQYINKINILIPTVNYYARLNVESESEKVYGVNNKKQIRYILNRVFSGDRRILWNPDSVYPLNELITDLGKSRRDENVFLTYLVCLYSLRTLSPMLKCVTAPDSIFLDLNILRSRFTRGSLSGTPFGIPTSIKGLFSKIQSDLTNNIPEGYKDVISTCLPYLTIFSDLPFELSYYQEDLSYCQFFPITRIPITPVTSLLAHYNHSNTGHIEIRFNPSDILFINSIGTDDELYSEYEIFRDVCRGLGLNFIFKDISSSDEFISTMNTEVAKVVIYFGHANHDIVLDKGNLVFSEDSLNTDELDKITHFPTILFLIGCETASASAFSGGLSSKFLNYGVQSILATLFPIPAVHAASFIGRLFSVISDLPPNTPVSLSTLVYTARKMGWQYDILEHLYNRGLLTVDDRLNIINDASIIIKEIHMKRGRDPKMDEISKIHDSIFEDYNILEDYEFQKKQIIPYSLFFTLLGNGHRVFFRVD